MTIEKNFDIQSFCIHPNSTICQKRFGIWTDDLNNILSTDQQTSSILAVHLAKIEPFTTSNWKNNVNKKRAHYFQQQNNNSIKCFSCGK
jgi:hypothetical protein